MDGTSHQVGDRRPIASRDRKVFQRIAHLLARSGLSPNAISILGMLAGLAGGLCLGLTFRAERMERLLWIASACFVQLRLLANMFDGMVAIETGRSSPVGELYNEIPDRISDTAILVGLGYAAGGQVALGYAAAAAAIFTAYVRTAGKVAGASQEFCGPMAKPQRMFVVTVVALFVGLVPAWLQPGWVVPELALIVIIAGSLLTALRRLARISKTLKARSAIA